MKTKFHGNFKGGLSLHTVMVIKQTLEFAKPVLDNFFTSPGAEKYILTAKDIFVRMENSAPVESEELSEENTEETD